MRIILDFMNIDLEVTEFIELLEKTDLFGHVNIRSRQVAPAVERELVVEPKKDQQIKSYTERQKEHEQKMSEVDLVGPYELAEFLNCGLSTVGKYRQAGMPSVRVSSPHGLIYKYNKPECLEWYKNYKENHPSFRNYTKPKAVVKHGDNETIDTAELAKILGAGQSTIYCFRQAGMPCIETKTKNGLKCFRYDKDACLSWYAEYRKNIENKAFAKDIRKPVAVPKKSPLDELTAYSIWKSQLNKACREAGKDVGKMLSLTYKYMTKNYGIVWDQEMKDYYNAKGYRPHSTTQLAYWMENNKPACKNLTYDCLLTILKEAKG